MKILRPYLQLNKISFTIWSLICFISLIIIGQLLGAYNLFLLTEILIWGLFAMSFDILFGYTGLLSFGQSMFFGIGTYGVLLSIKYLNVNIFEALLITILISFIVALITGYFALRLRGHYFVIITVIFSLVIFFFATHARWLTGGDDGITIELPKLKFLNIELSFYNPFVTYYFILTVISIIVMICWRLVHSPLGRVFTAIRENEERARFLGYNVQRFKLASYTISGIIGGIAGGLYTIILSYASTNFFYWTVSGDAVIWTIFGGKGTLLGSFLGALFFVVIKDELSSLFSFYPILVGTILIVFILKIPDGIVGLIKKKLAVFTLSNEGQKQIYKQKNDNISKKICDDEKTKFNSDMPILEIIKLTKKFNGLTAVNDVSFKMNFNDSTNILPPPSTVIIGANAAGKTTLFNLVTGLSKPDEGEIRFKGNILFKKNKNVNNQKDFQSEKILLKGIARTFQMINVFPNLTVYDNVWLGAQSRKNFFFNVKLALIKSESLTDVKEKVDSIINRIGLEEEKWKLAAQLSFGQQKMLEIGIALATDPKLLLLDEPLAGVSPKETNNFMRLLVELSQKTSLLIIEHDLDVVRELGFNTIVFNQGEKIAEGNPYDLLKRDDVKEIFLGEDTNAA